MKNIQSFTEEVCRELNYYVYRLVDPRNGRTFYVGKGRNNRVFAHAECALSRYNDVDYDPLADNDDNLKYRTIREITNAGLDVIYIIQRYGMNEHDALVAESVLIDAYAVLTNKIRGLNGQEPQNALTLQQNLSRPAFTDDPARLPRYMIIKVKDYWITEGKSRYDCTRSAWRVDPARAKKHPYVLSVSEGIVREVYKVHEWHLCADGSNRAEFTGEVAEDAVRDLFIDHKIPEKYRERGQANPCVYCKF